MIVAVTSITLARSSISVPICPGRTSSGARTRRGPRHRPPPVGRARSPPTASPAPGRPVSPGSDGRVPPATTPGRAAAEEECHGDGSGDRAAVDAERPSAVHRSSRIGTGSATAPFGIATTTVSPSEGSSSDRAERGRRTRRPSPSARLRRLRGPWKQVTRWIVAGRRHRRHGARSIGTVPLVADRVPEQLVVIGEPVERALDPIPDRVGVPAGDRPVRIPDADRRDPIFLARLRHPWEPSGSRRTRPDPVHTVVVVVVRQPCRDRPDDAVPPFVHEVVVDRLRDLEAPLDQDPYLHGVAVDPLDRRLRDARVPPARARRSATAANADDRSRLITPRRRTRSP